MMRVKRSSKKKWFILPGIILAIIGTGFVLWLQKTHTPASPPEGKNTITHSTATPSEEPIAKETYISTATGNEPSIIRLPSINTTAFIQKVGVDQRGEVAVPNNIHLAGWFTKGAKPGEAGLSIIDGHVNGLTQKAVFASLPDIKPGDEFEIEQANATILRYKVMGTKIVDASNAANFLFSQDSTVSSQLNLITCIGTFDQKANNYDKRFIASAKLL